MSDTSIFDLLVRHIGAQWVGPTGQRGALAAYDPAAAVTIAEAVLRVLPKEVLIGCGGCGGEPTVAGFREDGFKALSCKVAESFEIAPDSDEFSTWANIAAIPLIWRIPDNDELYSKYREVGALPALDVSAP